MLTVTFPQTSSVRAEQSTAGTPMSRSESVSTQASSSASTRPQRLRTRIPKAAMADSTTNTLLATKPGAKKRSSSEISDARTVLSSSSTKLAKLTKQSNKKRNLSSERTIMSSVATTSPFETLQGSVSTSPNPSFRHSPESPENAAQTAAQSSTNPSTPSKAAEKPKSGSRIKSYDAALEKAIERADEAERRATEAERRPHELEQDKFAANYENFEGPPTRKFHTTFEKKDQQIRDLQTRLEKHEVTIAKKKGEVYAHVAYKKELKASLVEKDKDIKVLKARQDALTTALIGRDAEIAEKEKIIAELQKQLDARRTAVADEDEEFKTLKATHDGCSDAMTTKDAEIQSLKAMHNGCNEAMESLSAEIKSLGAQASNDKSSLAQKVLFCIAIPA